MFVGGHVFAEAIIEEKTVIPEGKSDFLQIKYLKIKGTNEDIGKALADYASKNFNVKLSKYENPVFAKARIDYLRLNYPVLLERMKGVAASYGVSLDNHTYDLSGLPYDVGRVGCSAVYIVPKEAAKGKALLARNEDFFAVALPGKGPEGIFSHSFVMEIHPDKGYPALYMSAFDMLNGFSGGINSHGLTVVRLTDLSWPANKHPYYGGRSAGLSYLQMGRLILDSCKNVEEAKTALLNNKIYFPVIGGHYMVADKHGNSFIYEISHLDTSGHIIDNKGASQVLTNHPLFQGADDSAFRAREKNPGSSMARYERLKQFIDTNQSITEKSLWKAMRGVCAAEKTKTGGLKKPLPFYTLWTVVYHPEGLAMDIEFLLHAPVDKETGKRTLTMSDRYHFRLKSDDR